MAQFVMNILAMQETLIQFLGQEDLLEKEQATHFSSLALEIPQTEEPGGLQSMGSQGLDMTYNNINTQDDRNLLINLLSALRNLGIF